MSEQHLGTLLLSCPDQKGIVASVAHVLFGLGANILDADQHTDPIAQMFFQRIQFDLSAPDFEVSALHAALGELAQRFSLEWRLVLDMQNPRRGSLTMRIC